MWLAREPSVVGPRTKYLTLYKPQWVTHTHGHPPTLMLHSTCVNPAVNLTYLATRMVHLIHEMNKVRVNMCV